jgi:hypothetical protein
MVSFVISRLLFWALTRIMELLTGTEGWHPQLGSLLYGCSVRIAVQRQYAIERRKGERYG